MKVLDDVQMSLEAERVRRRDVAPLADRTCGAGTRFTIVSNDEVAPRIPDIAPGYGGNRGAGPDTTDVATHGAVSSAQPDHAGAYNPSRWSALRRYGNPIPKQNRPNPFAAFALGEKED